MPQIFPVTAATMNYAGPIMVGVCGASWLWYQLYWHRYYQGARLSSNHSDTSSHLEREDSKESSTYGEKI